eukprot:291933-Prorocentrum_minimum.AAC.1
MSAGLALRAVTFLSILASMAMTIRKTKAKAGRAAPLGHRYIRYAPLNQSGAQQFGPPTAARRTRVCYSRAWQARHTLLAKSNN